MGGRTPRRLGKSEARASFLPLVQALAQGGGPIEITDRGKVAAVLMSNEDYQLLLARAKEQPDPRSTLVGSMVLVDDLEPAQQAIDELFRKSLSRSAEEL